MLTKVIYSVKEQENNFSFQHGHFMMSISMGAFNSGRNERH